MPVQTPYKYDVVGSFLRPEKLKQARKDYEEKKISKDSEVKLEEMSVEDAKKAGAIGVFDNRYGDLVKVYTIGISKEICGGPHAKRTGELGHFRIVKEQSSSAGVRRIKAVLEY